MTHLTPPAGLEADDYELIQDAVMETARGRWFLLEYARRQRASETQRLLEAIEKLDRRVADATTPMTAQLGQRLNDLAWALRERGVANDLCLEIETLARAALDGVSPGEAPPALEKPPKISSSIIVEEPKASPVEHEPERVLPAPLLSTPVRPLGPDPRLTPLSWLDQLPLEDKLALFG